MVKKLLVNVGDLGSVPGSGRPPGEGNGNPLQYSCLGNPMDRGAWQATGDGAARVRHDLATKESSFKSQISQTILRPSNPLLFTLITSTATTAP